MPLSDPLHAIIRFWGWASFTVEWQRIVFIIMTDGPSSRDFQTWLTRCVPSRSMKAPSLLHLVMMASHSLRLILPWNQGSLTCDLCTTALYEGPSCSTLKLDIFRLAWAGPDSGCGGRSSWWEILTLHISAWKKYTQFYTRSNWSFATYFHSLPVVSRHPAHLAMKLNAPPARRTLAHHFSLIIRLEGEYRLFRMLGCFIVIHSSDSGWCAKWGVLKWIQYCI